MNENLILYLFKAGVSCIESNVIFRRKKIIAMITTTDIIILRFNVSEYQIDLKVLCNVGNSSVFHSLAISIYKQNN